MPTAPVLALLVAAPLVAGLVSLPLGRRNRQERALDVAATAAVVAIVAAVSSAATVATGGRTTWGLGGHTLLRFDEVAMLVAPVVALVATTVLLYARRNLEGDDRAARFASAAAFLLAGTLMAVAAATLTVLAAGWLVASVATVVLCGYRGTPAARASARRAARAFAIGDLALVGALATTLAAVGDPELSALSGAAAELQAWTVLTLGPVGVSAAALVAGLVVVAALARAGQVPLPRWLPGTVAAPTPVSALLHAGAVNAGAILLIRTSPITAQAPVTMVLLAVCTVATIAVVLPAARARSDVKGQLAESTSAQMAFMLLACAVGAPVVALTHLAGHALYKSARFLGAGDTIHHQVTRRRWLSSPSPHHLGTVAAIGGVVAVGVGAAWALVSGWAAVPGAERWVAGAALVALAVQVTRTIVGRGRAASPALGLVAAGAIATAAGVALAADHLVGPALFHSDAFVDPRVALVALGTLAGATALLGRTSSGAAWLAGVAPVAALAPARVSAQVRTPVPAVVRAAGSEHARVEPTGRAAAPALEGAR